MFTSPDKNNEPSAQHDVQSGDKHCGLAILPVSDVTGCLGILCPDLDITADEWDMRYRVIHTT